MSSDINLEEIMGVVEELKKCSYVKVIILVNEKAMSKSAKDILQKYEEKVIDRIYYIKFFPVTNMSDDKRYTCYNVMSILYCADSDRFLEYCDEIECDCDRMARYRMNKLVEEILRNF